MINQIATLCGTLCLILINTTANAQQRKLVDCKTGQPVSGVKIFNSRNKLIATANASGNYELSESDFPLFFEKDGFNMLQVNNQQELETACMSKYVRQLDEVVVSAKRVDPGDYLLQLRDENIPRFINHDTTTYYKFSYALELPFDHWKEQATGYIEHQWRPHKNVFPLTDYYLRYNYRNTDSSFVKTDQYKNVKGISLGQIMLSDLMGHYFGFREWKIIAKHKKRSHLVLSLENKDSLLEFSTYFEKGDVGYTTNKIRFDTAGNLLQCIQLRPPEPYHIKALRKSTDFYGKGENKRNSYYANYQYTTKDKTPRMLKRVEQKATCYNENIYYKLTYTIELVPFKPKKEIYIPAFNFENGMGIVNYNNISEEEKLKRDRKLKRFKKIFDIEIK